MSKFNLGDRVFIDCVNAKKTAKATVTMVLNGGVTVMVDGTTDFYTINDSYVYKRRSFIGKTFRRNSLKLINRRTNNFDIACGEVLTVKDRCRFPPVQSYVGGRTMYYTSEGFYIPVYRLRRYYEEV